MLAPIFLSNFSHLTLWILASCAIPRIYSNTILNSSTLSLMFTSTFSINNLSIHNPPAVYFEDQVPFNAFWLPLPDL